MTLIAFILAGGGLCCLLVRLVGGSRTLLGVLLASYALRVALALGFYLVSAYELPLFRTLQLPDGFWRFSYDAPSYHVNGARIAEALRGGTVLPQGMVGDHPYIAGSYDFFYLVGVVYWAVGAHSLYVPLLNAMLWTATAVLGYGLARRMKGETAGGVAAALMSFWPSSYIWSSQILKDSLAIFLLLLCLKLVIQVWEERRWSALPAAIVLIPAVFLLTRIRFYLVALLLLAVVLSIGLTLAVRFRQFRWGSIGRALTLLLLLWVPFLVANYVDPFHLLYAGELDILANEINEILEARPEKGPTPVVPLQEAKAKPETGPTPVVPVQEAKAKPEKGPAPPAPPQEVKPEKGRTPAVPLQEAKAKSEGGPTPAAIPLKIKPARNLASLLHPHRLPKIIKLVVQRMIPSNINLAHRTYNIQYIETRRTGYARAGGASSFATDVQFRNVWDTAAFLPLSLAYAFYAPFPWEWFSPGRDTGSFKGLAGVETVLMILLTPFLLLGGLRAIRSGRTDAWMILIFGVITIVSLALTVTNFGILFRLRLPSLTSFFILVAAYGINAETLRRPIILRNFFR